jgi:hypothetical protein
MKVRSNIKAGQPSITVNANTTVTVTPTNTIEINNNVLTAGAK